jgi:hypothetical protein
VTHITGSLNGELTHPVSADVKRHADPHAFFCFLRFSFSEFPVLLKACRSFMVNRIIAIRFHPAGGFQFFLLSVFSHPYPLLSGIIGLKNAFPLHTDQRRSDYGTVLLLLVNVVFMDTCDFYFC